VLVTGFEPYGSFHYNPSEEVARILDGAEVGGFRVIGRVLPVSLKRAPPTLLRLLEKYRPKVVLALGLAPRAKSVVVELAFANVADFRASDADGSRAEMVKLAEDGPLVLPTHLPVDAIVSTCRGRGLRLSPGVSAGTYLCNVIGYLVSRYSQDSRAVGGFLHIPPTTDLAMRHKLEWGMPMHEVLAAVRCVLEVAIERASREIL
jgi:pyroglutamyl-peptidase